MGKVLKTVTTPAAKPAAKTIGERVYALSKETKGTWLYMWENAPSETPDWAKKWYMLKTEYAANPGQRIKVTMTA